MFSRPVIFEFARAMRRLRVLSEGASDSRVNPFGALGMLSWITRSENLELAYAPESERSISEKYMKS